MPARFPLPGPQHPYDSDDQNAGGALDLERWHSLHAEPKPTRSDHDPRVDLVGIVGLLLILAYLAYQLGDWLAS